MGEAMKPRENLLTGIRGQVKDMLSQARNVIKEMAPPALNSAEFKQKYGMGKTQWAEMERQVGKESMDRIKQDINGGKL